MNNSETSEDGDADSKADARRKAAEVPAIVAMAGHTFEFGRSTMMKGCIRELEKLNYFVKGDERAPREEIVSKPESGMKLLFSKITSLSGCACLRTRLWWR
jgi:hypothetical protein